MAYNSAQKRREYDRQRYKTHKKDTDTSRKRHFGLYLTEQMIAIMQRLAMEGMAKGTNPWRTTQEVARGLLVKGFETMRGEQETIDEFLPLLALEQQLAGLSRAQRTAESMLAMARKNIKALLEIGATDTALQFYSTAIHSARELPKTVWSNWLLDQLAKSFPSLAREERAGRVPGVQLGRQSKSGKGKKS